tara:strand:- start:2743 stop:2928 length:186 start_codon:yes stop_codon:yes gene_type:complete
MSPSEYNYSVVLSVEISIVTSVSCGISALSIILDDPQAIKNNGNINIVKFFIFIPFIKFFL